MKSLQERLDEKIDKSGGPNACWPWNGFRTASGYGAIRVGVCRTTGDRGRLVRAHRLVYEQNVGAIPRSLIVRHRCDNPPCCNPVHLLIGTDADNKADMVERERQARGEGHGNARLSEADVHAIREAHAKGEGQHPIARRFCVTRSLIQQIVQRKAWRHVALYARGGST